MLTRWLKVSKFFLEHPVEIMHRAWSAPHAFEQGWRDQRNQYDTFMTNNTVHALIVLDPSGWGSDGELVCPIGKNFSDGDTREDVDEGDDYDTSSGFSYNYRAPAEGRKGSDYKYDMAASLQNLDNMIQVVFDESKDNKTRGDAFDYFADNLGYFEREIDYLDTVIEDINTDPSSTGHMKGGRIVARLAAHDAAPHMEILRKSHEEMLAISNGTLKIDNKQERLKELTRQATEAHQASKKIFEEMTVVDQTVGLNVWGPTQALLRQQLGRRERDITQADRDRYIELLKENQRQKDKSKKHKGIVPLPDVVTGEIPMPYGNLDWQPTLTAGFKSPPGSNWGKENADLFKWVVYAPDMSGVNDIDPEKDQKSYEAMLHNANARIIENGTQLLKKGERNLLIHALALVALQYSTNLNNTANRASGINTYLASDILELDKEGVWEKHGMVDLVRHMFNTQDSSGANAQRKLRKQIFEYMRNPVFAGDYGNEVDNEADNEKKGALKWRWGIGAPKWCGEYLSAKGAPYYAITYKIAKPVEKIGKLLGFQHETGGILKSMWAHKKRTLIGGAVALGALALLNPGLVMWGMGLGWSALVGTAGFVLPYIPTIVSGMVSTAGFLYGLGVPGLVVGGLALAALKLHKPLRKMFTKNMSKKERKEMKAPKEEVAIEETIPSSDKRAEPSIKHLDLDFGEHEPDFGPDLTVGKEGVSAEIDFGSDKNMSEAFTTAMRQVMSEAMGRDVKPEEKKSEKKELTAEELSELDYTFM